MSVVQALRRIIQHLDGGKTGSVNKLGEDVQLDHPLLLELKKRCGSGGARGLADLAHFMRNSFDPQWVRARGSRG